MLLRKHGTRQSARPGTTLVVFEYSAVAKYGLHCGAQPLRQVGHLREDASSERNPKIERHG